MGAQCALAPWIAVSAQQLPTLMHRNPWILSLAACCLAAAVWAGFAPLGDPDLPMHLTIGEWIYTHHRVPFVEPFAWTRAGEPYYAYSWLAQLTFYAAIRASGPIGLHVLSAILGASIVLAGFAAGRSLELSISRSTVLGVLSIAIAMESTPFLRPQLLMHALIPLAWASAFWLVREQASNATYAALALWLISALAAGTHITFPVVAAPLVVLWARADAHNVSRVLTATAVVVLGWLTSPYALHWPDVFALNLGYNAINAALSSAGELAPGFAVSPLVGVALAALPLVVDTRAIPLRQRSAMGLLWLAGLVVFARYFKGLGPWWWCALPLVVLTLRRLPGASDRRVALSWAILTPLVVLACSPTNIRLWKGTRAFEGGTESRMLPSLKAFAAEPAARWLESHAAIPAGTRLLTTFNYGSYLKWRLPALSESIDSRGVFPDSVALPDVPSTSTVRPMGPWESADLAIVPETYPVAGILDRHHAWRRIGTAARAPWERTAPRAALWARREWLRSHARSSLPDSSAALDLK